MAAPLLDDGRRRYSQETDKLQSHFKAAMVELKEPIRITEQEYKMGTDSLLKTSHGDLIREAVDKWNSKGEYELSYSQLCRAFFGAARELGKLDVVLAHPDFPLGVEVFIREVVDKRSGWRERMVPATKTSVSGDEHIFTHDSNRSLCSVFSTKDLSDALLIRR